MRGVTPVELAQVMQDNGKHIAASTIRWHCSSPTGLLYGSAELVGRSWQIDPDAADRFAAGWVRYANLKKTRK